jgi:hypothetical protein
MSVREAKSIYDSLLKSGDLLDFYPNLTGVWLEDKKEFIIQYNSSQKLLEGDDDIFNEDFGWEPETY